MASLPADVLAGLTFGAVVGVLCAVAVGAGSFLLWRYGDRELPHVAAAGVALGVAGFNAYTLELFDPRLLLDGQTEALPRLVVGGVVVAVLALYGNSQGRMVADGLPRGTSMPSEREQRLSETVLDAIDSAGQVTITATDNVRDIEGHPPLSPDVRRQVAGSTWRLPADLPISELESRLAERLKSTHGFADVRVSIDARGQATVAAAPPTGSLAHRVPDGQRAVTIDTIVPTGIAPGDTVEIDADGRHVEGTVLDTRVDDGAVTGEPGSPGTASGDRPADGESPGGPGTITVSVDTAAAGDLLDSPRATVVVEPEETDHALAALSHLERTDAIVRKLSVDEQTLSFLENNADRLRPIAVRDPVEQDRRGWRILTEVIEGGASTRAKTNGDTPEQARAGGLRGFLQPGCEAFVVGPEALLRQVTDERASADAVVVR